MFRRGYAVSGKRAVKIAMFGGSFNPVHNGHIELAKAVHEQAGYDKVLFVPAYHSPFKALPSGATDEDRLCMLHLALDGFDWACIEDCELKRGGVSYTYETVEFLERKYAASGETGEKRAVRLAGDTGEKCADKHTDKLTGKLGLVIGADLVAGFPQWYRANELASKVDIILARRKLDGDAAGQTPHETGAPKADAAERASQEQPTLPFAHFELQNPYVDVSSSEIRQAVRDKKMLRALVPERVCDYILERGLYD